MHYSLRSFPNYFSPEMQFSQSWLGLDDKPLEAKARKNPFGTLLDAINSGKEKYNGKTAFG